MSRESLAARGARAQRIVRALARAYPDAQCALEHRTPFQLLIATILSAQCTDAKVNEVTPALFRRYPSPDALAEADPGEVEALIRPTGFYRQKAKSILGAARGLVERFGGQVPKELDALTSLRGVARKTANVVLGTAFGIPGIAVDTHMKRVNQRLGLTRAEDPDVIERELMALIPEAEWTRYTHRVIQHGRACCDARRPRCPICPLRDDCPWPDAARRERTTGAGEAAGSASRSSTRKRRR
ncbi:MAG: endonuclease III [Myxococcales bacterium]|nr:endonuclease III [Myxococcales bacterium]MDH5566345.1 endonuclease III [Myxococcales bacterium]